MLLGCLACVTLLSYVLLWPGEGHQPLTQRFRWAEGGIPTRPSLPRYHTSLQSSRLHRGPGGPKTTITTPQDSTKTCNPPRQERSGTHVLQFPPKCHLLAGSFKNLPSNDQSAPGRADIKTNVPPCQLSSLLHSDSQGQGADGTGAPSCRRESISLKTGQSSQFPPRDLP